MRKAYLELPSGSLATAGTVMLDWNISARIANIHKRQLSFQQLNASSIEMDRLRSLVSAIPPGAEILSAFGAAEPETRRMQAVSDIDRYNQRTDIASVYLSQVPEYSAMRNGLSALWCGRWTLRSPKQGDLEIRRQVRSWLTCKPARRRSCPSM